MCLSTGRYPTIDYVALSYCWESKSIFSATDDNLLDCLVQVQWSKLPATFQHAIRITRLLGYRYIWIDLLCIIQGSDEDFVRQCKSMGEIYRNAVLVISADSADSVQTGFLNPRDHASIVVRIPPWKRRTSETGNDLKRIFARPHVLDTSMFMQKDGHDCFRSSPVIGRGRCFQEQYLASRVVHFTKNELYWECEN
ncbi:heterokaryon incompatibility [Xylariaceae sp. FL0255]|nr:heterokaryon incompatibility [Xylariaceae sp. FL0255]